MKYFRIKAKLIDYDPKLIYFCELKPLKVELDLSEYTLPFHATFMCYASTFIYLHV